MFGSGTLNGSAPLLLGWFVSSVVITTSSSIAFGQDSSRPLPAAAGGDPTPNASLPSTERAELQALREELARQKAASDAQAAALTSLRADADKKALLEAQTAAELAQSEERLRLYGFVDFGLQKSWFPSSSGLNTVIESTSSTFVLGNVNLYLDARPNDRWRALTEIRFTGYPHGEFTQAQPGRAFQRTNNQIFDVNSASGGFAQTRWGAIILERAQIEYSWADWLRVRGGYWFTPYGIWNVDHGTPTLISLNVPQFVVFEAFPARQLGVDVNGTLSTGAWDIDYHAYVSNGRTPGQLDPTEDKMVGGRLALSRTTPLSITVGASSFYGRYSDQQARLVKFDPPLFTHDEVAAYKELGVGGDFALDARRLRFRTEFALNRRVYEQGKHEPGWYPGAYFPSRIFWGTYALLAYDTGLAGIEPYLYAEFDRNMLPVSQGIITPSVGLNLHFTDSSQLKLQYSYTKQFDFDNLGRDLSHEHLNFLATRLVVAF